MESASRDPESSQTHRKNTLIEIPQVSANQQHMWASPDSSVPQCPDRLPGDQERSWGGNVPITCFREMTSPATIPVPATFLSGDCQVGGHCYGKWLWGSSIKCLPALMVQCWLEHWWEGGGGGGGAGPSMCPLCHPVWELVKAWRIQH